MGVATRDSNLKEALKMESSQVVKFLGRRDAYSPPTAKLQVIETHISWVFVTDRFVYKLKKPVSFGFVDFSTSELRREACLAEVRLNTRLTSDIYQGVLPITLGRNRRFKLGGDGEAIDWVVKMRRLPADQTLEYLIANEQILPADIDRIAAKLMEFYLRLPPLTIKTDEFRKKIEQHVRDNRQELISPRYGFDAALVKRIHSRQLRVLRLKSDMFDNRVCDGRIVEGHGDLRPEHIYLNATPQIIDCLEFSQDLRSLDIWDDLNFLAMACSHLGAESVGQRILDYYLRGSGDQPPAALGDFYQSYRACVRAKVLALRSEQLVGGQRAQALIDAEKYLLLADRKSAQLGPQLLLVVRGLSGTGKSAISMSLTEDLGVELLQTDVLRREIFGDEAKPAQHNQDIYSPQNKAKVYQFMLHRAEQLLQKGLSVVLDGAFLSASQRDQAIALGRQCKALAIVVHCRCPEELAMDRISSRNEEDRAHSDAWPELHKLQLREEEPNSAQTPLCEVDTSTSIPAMMQAVYACLRSQGAV